MLKYLAVLVIATLAFIASSSAGFLTQMQWWDHPYYLYNGWFTAWYDKVSDLTLAGFKRESMRMKGALGLGLLTGMAGAFLAGSVAARFLPATGRGARARGSLFGKSEWQTMRGAKESGITFHLIPPPDGVILGKKFLTPWFDIPYKYSKKYQRWIKFRVGFGLYAVSRGDTHVSLTAPTRQGKGIGFVNPNVLNWKGPKFIFSVKDDVYNACAAECVKQGYRVFVFDVTNPRYETHRFSGLGELIDTYDDIQRAMFTLIPEVKTANPFWSDCARMVATAAGILLARTPGMKPTIGNILALIRREDYEENLLKMIDTGRRNRYPYPNAAVEIILDWLKNSESTGGPAKASVKQTIITSLALWNVPRIKAATSGDDFKIGSIRKDRIAVFVIAQPGDIDRLRPIYNLFFTQLFYMNAQNEWSPGKLHYPIRTLAVFDERWALGSMRVVDDAMAFIASYGFRMLNVLQTKGQMVNALGEEGSRNMFDNSYIEMIYGGTDLKTAKEVSERMGYDTVEKESHSRLRWIPFAIGSHNKNTSLERRPLLLPQEVSGLSSDTVVVLIKGRPALKLTKIKSYEDGYFKHMGGKPPKAPKLEIDEDLIDENGPPDSSFEGAFGAESVSRETAPAGNLALLLGADARP